MTDEPRAPSEDDVPALVRLWSEHWPEPADEALVRRTWSAPRFDLEHDARIEPNCYVGVENLGHGRAWIDIRGNPSAAILDWAEKRAGEIGPRLLAGAWFSNEPVRRELERRAFSRVRHAHRMMADLTEASSDPRLPDGMEVRTFRAGDERTFYEAHQETFEDSWEPIEEQYDEWAHWLLEPPAFVPELWFLAAAGREPTGFAICHPHPADATLGWVRILGVRRQWRRLGLGRALLLHAFAEFRRRGMKRAGLGVDAESITGANKLYEAAGMHVSARFDIYEKVVV